MRTKKTPKPRRRYSIGEWYGVGFEKIPSKELHELAVRELKVDDITGTACPFQRNPPRTCNKKGGVCSLRLYEQLANGPVAGCGSIVTTCPMRFLENSTIYSWIGEILLQTPDPIVLGEIGFLDRLRPDEEEEQLDEESQDFIGRIDNVLVHPSKAPIEWCALELQAVYFSGKAMSKEFKMLASELHNALQFPSAHRRPDWRSSGPKRLLPQLQTKVPTIRTWGKKMAVVIDEAFFASLVGLKPEKHLTNAEIIWFVVGYDESPSGWTLSKRTVIYTRLEDSVKALTGGTPLPKERFEMQLRQKLAKKYPTHPLALGH